VHVHVFACTSISSLLHAYTQHPDTMPARDEQTATRSVHMKCTSDMRACLDVDSGEHYPVRITMNDAFSVRHVTTCQ